MAITDARTSDIDEAVREATKGLSDEQRDYLAEQFGESEEYMEWAGVMAFSFQISPIKAIAIMSIGVEIGFYLAEKVKKRQ